MKVFVTGGTGFVGQEILWRLRDAGHALRILSRKADSNPVRQLAYRHQAETVRGDTKDSAAIRNGLEGCQAIIHLVGIISESKANTFQEAHVEATRTMVTLAREAGINRFIHMSALGTRPEAVAQYHRTKWAAEEIVRNSGLEWTIFRPSVIYGRNDGFVNLLAKICRLSPGIVVIPGNGRNKLQPITVEDVARCFVAALEEPQAVHQTFDLGGSEVFTLDEIYDVILRVGNRRRLKLHLPLSIADLQASVMETVFGWFGAASPLTRDQLLMLQEDNVGNPEPARTLFHLKPSSFEEGIAKYLR